MADEKDIEIGKLRVANQKATECRLALFDAKNQLEFQYEELNNQYVSLISKLEELQNQLKTAQINKREEILKCKINEENLLNEKHIREEHLNNEVKVYQQKIRSLKQRNESLCIENKNMLSNSEQLYKKIQDLNELNQKLKYNLKEKENQERLLLVHNTELDKQNIKLQQQVDKLENNLINYDKLNNENKQLQEDIVELQQRMKDLGSLKTFAESQLIELHETLRDERKQKYIYKQQLDDYIQKESRRNLNSLRTELGDTHVQSNNVYLNSCDDDDDDAYHMISLIDYSHTSESDQQLSESLFSEIHKLEQECSPLSTTNCSLDNQLNENMKILFHKIEHFTEQMFPNRIFSSTSNSDDTNDLLLKSIEQIDENLNLMMKQSNDTHKLQDQEQINRLQKRLKETEEAAVFALANLKCTHENEKLGFIKTISKLRSELERRIQADEEEKRTVYALFRMAVEQKFLLKQKLQRDENKNVPS